MSSSSWKEMQLKDLSDKITKGTTPTTLGHPFVDEGVNFIKAETLTFDGTIERGKFVFISPETHEKLKRSQIQEGDILFSMAGMVLGKTAVVPKELTPANTNQALAIIRLNQDKALPKFVDYFMRQKSFFAYVNSSTGQSAQPNINLEEIGNLTINLPSLDTQREIVSILSCLDDKIELNRQTNATLEAIAQALFKEWFVDFNYPGATREMVETEMGMVPEGWEIKRIGDIIIVTDYVANGSFASLKENVTLYDEPNYGLYVRTTDGKSDYNGKLKYVDMASYDFLKKSRLFGDEIIVSNVGDIGTVFRPPKWFNKPMTLGSNAIMLKTNTLNNYLYMFFKSVLGQYLLGGIVSGSAQPKFNKTDFRNLAIPIPSKEVINEYNKICESMTSEISNLKSQIMTLTQLRDGLLPRLMKGEINF